MDIIMKNILIICLLNIIFVFAEAQPEFRVETVYFTSNKIEIKDSNFINLFDSLKKNDIICKLYQKYNFYSMIIDKNDDNVFEAHITMVPGILKWTRTAQGYFYIGESLFFIKGDLPDNFAIITNLKKKFYYKIDPTKAITQEFCVIILRFENNKWYFIEERQN